MFRFRQVAGWQLAAKNSAIGVCFKTKNAGNLTWGTDIPVFVLGRG
jgi:hypothetical protein